MKDKEKKGINFILTLLLCSFCLFLGGCTENTMTVDADAQQSTSRPSSAENRFSKDGTKESIRRLYEEYKEAFMDIERISQISPSGFRVIEEHIFPIEMKSFGEVNVIPAFHEKYNRLALFFALTDGTVVYKTEELETNNRNRGEMEQSTRGISAISFRDLNEDGNMDIVLLTSFSNLEDDYAADSYKIGDVLFQDEAGKEFYRDYRITDKLNRYGMNKSAELITAFVRDGYSTEFMYTATTLEELLSHGLEIITEQAYPRDFEKLGWLEVIPGTYRIADYEVFMIYLVNEEGYIVSSLQPMEAYDNLYALRGVSCWDIDGDGLKDVAVLARYSYEGSNHELTVKMDYSIYYQRTGGFVEDTQIKEVYRCTEEETMENLVRQGRAYWGWTREE